MKIKELKSIGVEKLSEIENKFYEVNLFLCDILNLNIKDILLDQDKEVSIVDENRFLEAISRRAKGEPYAYIMNYKEFYANRFYVDNRVLIPRPESEFIVEYAVNNYKNKNIKYLDMCTGSGAIGISIAKALNIKADLSDISSDALEVARENANYNDVKVNIIKSDLFCNIEDKYDLITINPPYIPSTRKNSLQIEIDYEPEIALFAGEDGLDIIKKIINNYESYLLPSGKIIMEIEESQSEVIKKTVNCEIIKDLNDLDRFVIINK